MVCLSDTVPALLPLTATTAEKRSWCVLYRQGLCAMQFYLMLNACADKARLCDVESIWKTGTTREEVLKEAKNPYRRPGAVANVK